MCVIFMQFVFFLVDTCEPGRNQTAFLETAHDSQLSGSSFLHYRYAYNRSRLHTQTESGEAKDAWIARLNEIGEYIQAAFTDVRRVEAVATQGRADANQWVTSYKFAYSMDGVTFEYVRDVDGSERVFSGNSDRDMVVRHSLFSVVLARFVRLYPQDYNDHMTLRWEVYGCVHIGT